MCCERAWAGAAAALASQKFSSQSHLVSFNETNAEERSVREGCSAWDQARPTSKGGTPGNVCWSYLAAEWRLVGCISISLAPEKNTFSMIFSPRKEAHKNQQNTLNPDFNAGQEKATYWGNHLFCGVLVINCWTCWHGLGSVKRALISKCFIPPIPHVSSFWQGIIFRSASRQI